MTASSMLGDGVSMIGFDARCLHSLDSVADAWRASARWLDARC
ncbi:hypothetical protein OAO87_03160 [bacterium]|nr:hypothetical protein [bacterium]